LKINNKKKKWTEITNNHNATTYHTLYNPVVAYHTEVCVSWLFAFFLKTYFRNEFFRCDNDVFKQVSTYKLLYVSMNTIFAGVRMMSYYYSNFIRERHVSKIFVYSSVHYTMCTDTIIILLPFVGYISPVRQRRKQRRPWRTDRRPAVVVSLLRVVRA